jgi:hypothetical protein
MRKFFSKCVFFIGLAFVPMTMYLGDRTFNQLWRSVTDLHAYNFKVLFYLVIIVCSFLGWAIFATLTFVPLMVRDMMSQRDTRPRLIWVAWGTIALAIALVVLAESAMTYLRWNTFLWGEVPTSAFGFLRFAVSCAIISVLVFVVNIYCYKFVPVADWLSKLP